MTRPLELTLLTQAACAFCDDAKAILRRLAVDHPLEIVEVDLNSGTGRRLAEQAGVLFPPGVLVDGDPVAYGRPSERHLRRELRRRLERTWHRPRLVAGASDTARSGGWRCKPGCTERLR